MYNKIIELMNKLFPNQWFLDSGSLLSVVREGEFFKNDEDIDISAIVDSYDDIRIAEVAKKMTQLGFVVSRYMWKNTVYKYCFAPPPFSSFKLFIDLHLFVKSKNEYICPQFSLMIKNSVIASFAAIRKGDNIIYRNSFSSRIKVSIAWVYRYVFHYFGQPMRMEKYNNTNQGICSLWVIPCNMFNGTKAGSYMKFCILADAEPYLEYRYGDWKQPVSDWVTLRDDGGLRPSSKEEFERLLCGGEKYEH